jgi:KDO2-lipid IV(A) lauroyltransferase
VKYLQLKSAEFISRLLPRKICYGLARRVADLYVLFDRRGRESVIANLQRIHQYSGISLTQRALRALARENFLNFAKYLVDFFQFLRPQPERLQRVVDFGNATEILDKLLAHGKGVIVVSAHLGNWELGASALASLGYTFNVVTLWQPDPKLNELYQRQRMARQLRPIPLGRAARGCMAALRRNEIVAVVGDRDFSGSRNTVEFFGQPARLPDGPAKLALVTGAPLLPIFMIRLPNDTFKYIVEEPIWADKSRESVPDVMRRIAVAMEHVISQHSEQWFLFHNLWDIEEDRLLATMAAFGAPPADADAANSVRGGQENHENVPRLQDKSGA